MSPSRNVTRLTQWTRQWIHTTIKKQELEQSTDISKEILIRANDQDGNPKQVRVDYNKKKSKKKRKRQGEQGERMEK
jgi:hypothetical protein